MKKTLLRLLGYSSLVALGATVAHADTVLTFDTLPTGTPAQTHNARIQDWFGDNVTASSAGIAVSGQATPDIGLTWSAASTISDAATRWDYYLLGPWSAAQFNQDRIGDYYNLRFTPANGAAAIIQSFKFHGYYGVRSNYPTAGSNVVERFTYNWEVFDGDFLNLLTNGTYTFLSDATKNHQINVNYTGLPSQPLLLRLTRQASVLGGGPDPAEIEAENSDLALDDITFGEIPGTTNSIAITSVTPADGSIYQSPYFRYRATIQDGNWNYVQAASVQLRLNGMALTPVTTKAGLVTTVNFLSGGLLQNNSTNTYTLTFSDQSGNSYTNESTFVPHYTSYEWRFTEGDLATAVGNGSLEYADAETGTLVAFGTTDGSTVPHIGGNPAKYIHVPILPNVGNGLALTFNDTGPNGGGAYVNQYSVILDLMRPTPVTNYAAIFQTDTFNTPGNDADFYVAPMTPVVVNGLIGIGSSGYSPNNSFVPNTWYRVAFVKHTQVGFATNMIVYLNGTPVKTNSAATGTYFSTTHNIGVDGRWSLTSNQDPGTDLLLFNESDTSGNYTGEWYVSSVGFADRSLSSAEIAALGPVKSTGVFVPGLTNPPALALQKSGTNVTVSWATNYVGYALQRKTDLNASTWLPVFGVTNNAATVSAGPQAQFFRLVQ